MISRGKLLIILGIGLGALTLFALILLFNMPLPTSTEIKLCQQHGYLKAAEINGEIVCYDPFFRIGQK